MIGGQGFGDEARLLKEGKLQEHCPILPSAIEFTLLSTVVHLGLECTGAECYRLHNPSENHRMMAGISTYPTRSIQLKVRSSLPQT